MPPAEEQGLICHLSAGTAEAGYGPTQQTAFNRQKSNLPNLPNDA